MASVNTSVTIEEPFNFVTRYFEIQPGGYSTLERHQHPHAVVVIRGRGRVMLGDRSRRNAPGHDLVLPPHRADLGRGQRCGERPPDARADVWTVHAAHNLQAVLLKQNEAFPETGNASHAALRGLLQ